MATHNLECQKCGLIRTFTASPFPSQLPVCACGGELLILWSAPLQQNAAAHPSERTVVWMDKDGHVSYPPRNDATMPDRYRAAGYQRVEFEHAREVERFEKEKGVRCEGLWYNRGNGIQ